MRVARARREDGHERRGGTNHKIEIVALFADQDRDPQHKVPGPDLFMFLWIHILVAIWVARNIPSKKADNQDAEPIGKILISGILIKNMGSQFQKGSLS